MLFKHFSSTSCLKTDYTTTFQPFSYLNWKYLRAETVPRVCIFITLSILGCWYQLEPLYVALQIISTSFYVKSEGKWEVGSLLHFNLCKIDTGFELHTSVFVKTSVVTGIYGNSLSTWTFPGLHSVWYWILIIWRSVCCGTVVSDSLWMTASSLSGSQSLLSF